MKKLAARGLSRAEQERMAEEILARLDHYSSSTAAATTTTSTTTTTTPPHLLHHRHRHHHQLRLFDLHLSPRAARLAEEMVDEQPPEPSNLRYSQEFLGFEDSEAETDLLTQEEEEEMEDMEVEEEEEDMIQHYRITEDLDDLTRNKREKAMAEERRRRSRQNRRSERREECRKRRERCKQLRSVKRRRRRRDKEVRKMINETIQLHEDENGTKYIDCCPSVLVSINKTFGKSHLYFTMDIKPGHEAFTERLCMEGFENKECIIPASALKPEVSTRCIQQYSYSQALIRLKGTNDDWEVGSILVGSGCSCQVSINLKKKKRKRKKR